MEMQNVLLNHPMPNILTDRIISPRVLHMLKERKSRAEIAQSLHLTDAQVIDDIVILIQTGQPITKTDISCISHLDFKAFGDVVNLFGIDAPVTTIQDKYFIATNDEIDSGYVRLALTYYAVRVHLTQSAVPYIDCEENVLINGEKLIMAERQALNTNYETDRQYAPVARNRYAYNVISYLFGFNGYYDYGDHYDYDYDEFYYEMNDYNDTEYASFEESGEEVVEESDGESVEESVEEDDVEVIDDGNEEIPGGGGGDEEVRIESVNQNDEESGTDDESLEEFVIHQKRRRILG